jgi:glycosyltransferase involved in cell wall biosynthesis
MGGGHTQTGSTRNVGAPARLQPSAGLTVTVLLCTFNGERFLEEQLESLRRQSFTNWKLIASDDGSSDRTRSILQAFKASQRPGQVDIIDGPRRGAPANFLFLACREDLADDYYAFCDQDDVWETDRLERAIAILEQMDANVPAVYGSRTRLIDDAGCETGLSPLFSRAPTFRCALVQNIASGNTMVFNQKARELLVFGGSDVIVPFHDWWLYQATSACGGQVYYDPWPSVRYRQHAQNITGCSTGLVAFLRRLRILGQGRFRYWTNLNVAALGRLRPRMTAESERIFGLFCQARHRPLPQRAAMFVQAGLYRQTLSDNLGLAVAVALGKI